MRLGHLRLRQGKEDEARALFERALPLPQAVIAIGELDLAAGDATAAAEAAERVLRNLPGKASSTGSRRSSCSPARTPPAAITSAPGSWPLRLARDAERLATPYMRGRAARVQADVLMAAGDHDAARRAAEDAVDLFAASSAPYECAHARLLRAGALEALGRGDQAEAEARAARETLALLGARQEPEDGRPAELTVREVEILRLVADGLSRRRDRRAAVSEPAHGAPPRGEYPHEAPRALARGRGRPRHSASACSRRRLADSGHSE